LFFHVTKDPQTLYSVLRKQFTKETSTKAMTGGTKESGSGKNIRTLTTEQTIVFEAVNFMFLFAISAENTINVAWYSVCCIQSVISCVLYVPV